MDKNKNKIMTKEISDPLIINDFKNVYSPSDDSYLIIDYFKKNMNHDYFDGIKNEKVEKILDMGTGTGIIALFLQSVKSQFPNYNPEIIASDILEESIQCAKKNLKLNNFKDQIKFYRSDLFKSFSKSLKHSFNIIIFNPPYLPSSEIINENKSKSNIDYSWDGGRNGYELIAEFIGDLKHFFKSPGHVYFITSSRLDLESLYEIIAKNDYLNEIISKKHVFFEDIFLNRMKLI